MSSVIDLPLNRSSTLHYATALACVHVGRREHEHSRPPLRVQRVWRGRAVSRACVGYTWAYRAEGGGQVGAGKGQPVSTGQWCDAGAPAASRGTFPVARHSAASILVVELLLLCLIVEGTGKQPTVTCWGQGCMPCARQARCASKYQRENGTEDWPNATIAPGGAAVGSSVLQCVEPLRQALGHGRPVSGGCHRRGCSMRSSAHGRASGPKDFVARSTPAAICHLTDTQ